MLRVIIFFIIFAFISLAQEYDILIDDQSMEQHNDTYDDDDDNYAEYIKNYTIFYPQGIVAHVQVILKHEKDTGYLYKCFVDNINENQASFTVNNQPCIPHCDMYVAQYTIINLDCSITTDHIQIETIKDVSTLSFNQCPQFLNNTCLSDVKTCFCDTWKDGVSTSFCPVKPNSATCTEPKTDKPKTSTTPLLTTTEPKTSTTPLLTTTEPKTSTTPLLTTTEPKTSTATTLPPLTVLDYYDIFYTGSQVHFDLTSIYSHQAGTYLYEVNIVTISSYDSIFLGSQKCVLNCSTYANNQEPVLISLETPGAIGNLTILTDNFITYLYVNNCKQSFSPRQCKTQFVPYWCVCHTKDVENIQPELCDLNVPLDMCDNNTPPPSSRIASYHISYGNDPFSGVFVDMLYFRGQYMYIFEIMPDTLVPVYLDGKVCQSHCEAQDANGGALVNLQIGSSANFTFEGLNGKPLIYYNGCLQPNTSTCLSDFSMFCFCQTFPLTFEFADVSPMCGSSVAFDTCLETTSTSIGTSNTIVPWRSTTRFPKTTSTLATTPTTMKHTSPTTVTTTVQKTTHTSTTLASTATTPTTEPTTTTGVPTTPSTPSLANLTNSGVSLDNVTYVLSVTIEYTENATTLQSTDISDVSTILTNSANLEGLPSSDASLILQNIDNVLNAGDDQIEKSQSQDKFLSILPTLVMNTKASEVQYLNGNNMGFSSGSVQQTSVNGLTDQGNSFLTLNSSNLPQSHLNSIVLHAGENGNLPQGTKALFTIFRSKKFFNGKSALRNYPTYTHSFMQTNDLQDALASKCIRQFQLPDDSPVMSATVIQPDGYRISKLASYNMSARLHVNTQNLLRPLHGQMIVSWWKTDTNKWSTDDLCSTESHDHLISATCDHLTDFALIIDSMVNDPVVCDSGLISVGYVVNILSLTCLLIVILIQFSDNVPICARQRFLQRLKGPPLQKSDHMQMAQNIMLFLFYLFFLIFSNESISGKGCNFIAAVIYSLLLCSIILTIFQSLRTVILFFPSSLHNLINGLMRPFVALTFGFIIPFLLCIILAATTPFFNRQDGFCWVRPDFIVYAIVIPVSILIINGCICTVLVAWRLFSAGFKFNRIGKAHDTHTKTKLLALFVLQFTMGMPWVLQYPTLYHSNTTFWHYAFSIVLGSQGTILAILYFYKNHRRWRESVRLSGRDWRVRNATSQTLQTRASS